MFGRRQFFTGIAATAGLVLMPLQKAWSDTVKTFHSVSQDSTALKRLERSDEDWRDYVDPDAWEVLFREKTERAFSSELDGRYLDGTYVCAACHLPMFTSAAKYDSGTGWPSFFQAIEGHMGTKTDYKLVWPRTEYHCIRCGGHQGHVFNDGPRPTGQRWCNNGLALRFVPASEPLPALRG